MRGHDGLILRVLVGCTHVIWLVLYVVTNSVLWMPPRAAPCDLAPGMIGGHAIGSAWHDVAAGDGREGICHACLVALVQNPPLVESESGCLWASCVRTARDRTAARLYARVIAVLGKMARVIS